MTSDARGVAYSGNTWALATAAGNIWTAPASADSWTKRYDPDGTPRSFQDIVWDGASFYACGDNRFTVRGNGTSFERVNFNSDSATLFGIAKGSANYVVVGGLNSSVRGWWSANGGDWTGATSIEAKLNMSTRSLFALIYAQGKFVAVGANGRIKTSSDDGKNWSENLGATGENAPNLTAIAFGEGKFLAVGAAGSARMSTDGGATFPQFTATFPNNVVPDLKGVAYGTIAGQNYFVAVGMGGAGNPRAYALPSGGSAWVDVGNPQWGTSDNWSFLDVAVANNRVVAVGEGGRVRVSQGPLNPVAGVTATGGGPQFSSASGNGQINVNVTPDDVPWNWRVKLPGNETWLAVTGGAGQFSGDQTLSYAVSRNDAETRTATLIFETVAEGQVALRELASFTVTQTGDTADFGGAVTHEAGPDGGFYTVRLNTSHNGVGWRATVIEATAEEWVRHTASGVGPFNISVDYQPYALLAGVRQAVIEIRRTVDNRLLATHTLTQRGPAPPPPESWGWARRDLGSDAPAGQWNAVVAGDDGWLVLGEGSRVARAPIGEVDWLSMVATTASPRDGLGVAWDGTRYIAAGQNGYIWFARDIAANDWGVKQDGTAPAALFDLLKTSVRYVAVGKDQAGRELILTSQDGAAGSWNRRDKLRDKELRAIAQQPGGKLVAVGHDGAVRTSDTGIDDWPGTTSGTTSPLWDVVYGGNQFVAVGNDGTVIRSANGLSWTPANTGIPPALMPRSVVYGQAGDGQNYYVIAGSGGPIHASRDGQNWFPASESDLGPLRAVAHRHLPDGSGLFIAVGDSGRIYSSRGPASGIAFTAPGEYAADATGPHRIPITATGAWSAYSTTAHTEANWLRLTAGGGRNGADLEFTLEPNPGPRRAANIRINGRNLNIIQNEPVTIDTEHLLPDAYTLAASQTEAVVPIHVRPPGTEWWAVKDEDWLTVEKTDATSLRLRASGPNASRIPRQATVQILVANGQGVAGEVGRFDVTHLPAQPLTPAHWSWRDVTPKDNEGKTTRWTSKQWNSVARGTKVWALVGQSGEVATSEVLEDAARWRMASLDTGINKTLWEVKWDGEKFLVAGLEKIRQGVQPDGADYETRLTRSGHVFYGLAHHAGVAVAVGKDDLGEGIIYSSANAGGRWDPDKDGTARIIHSVAYGKGRFVAVGQENPATHEAVVRLSLTGTDAWRAPTGRKPAGTLRRVDFAQNQFVAVGPDAHVATSPDGEMWTSRQPASGIPPAVNLKGITFGLGYYVAVGTTGANDHAPAYIYHSTDAVTWSPASATNYPLKNVTFAPLREPGGTLRGAFVALGEDGTLVISYGPNDYATPIQAPASLSYGYKARRAVEFNVDSGLPWTARVLGDATSWLTLRYTGRSPRLPVVFDLTSDNPNATPRIGLIQVGNGFSTANVQIIQAKKELEFFASPNPVWIRRKGRQNFPVTIVNNSPDRRWTVVNTNSAWLTVTLPAAPGDPLRLNATANNGSTGRQGYLALNIEASADLSDPARTYLLLVFQPGTDPTWNQEPPDLPPVSITPAP